MEARLPRSHAQFPSGELEHWPILT